MHDDDSYSASSDPLGDAFELRAIRVGLVLHVLLAIGLSFVPLFDVLGFERAFASGLLAAPTSAAVGLSMVSSSRNRGGGDLARIASYAIGISLLMLVPTMVAGVIVELLNQPCDQEQGFLFLLLVAGGNAMFGAALGVAAATLSQRMLWPVLVVIAAFALFLGKSLLLLYAEPQIFAYSVPFGYWPGSLYDEELQVTAALWAFRGYTLLVSLSLVAMARAFSSSEELTVEVARPRVTALLGSTLLVLVVVAVHRNGERLGFALDRDTIERELSRRVKTEHFDLFISPSVVPPQVALLIEDHELRYKQLEKYFGFAPPGRIKSFIYASPEEKSRLMGAGNTQIARPWAQEIHINGFDVPHPVLKHELAHVFAGVMAKGRFKVPASMGVFVNIGIVEGIAVAADWPANELTIHGWTRAMRELKLAPDMRATLSPTGFWSISSARAYTVAGSFVRYLIDHYGMDRFGQLYQTNDFGAAYSGHSLSDLVSEWEEYIDTLPLPKEELATAEHRFRRPGIFQKVCAHRAANLADQGYKQLESGDLEGGMEQLEQLLRYAPNQVQPLIDIADHLARSGRIDDARRYVKRAVDTPGITDRMRGEALEVLAGLDWREGKIEAAKRSYTAVLDLHLSNSSERLQLARLGALSRTDEVLARVLKRILLQELNGPRALLELGKVTRDTPEDPLAHYLYARQLEGVSAWDFALTELDAAIRGKLTPPALLREAEMTRGRVLLRAGRAEEAESSFRTVAELAPLPVQKLIAEDWRERAAFVASRPRQVRVE